MHNVYFLQSFYNKEIIRFCTLLDCFYLTHKIWVCPHQIQGELRWKEYRDWDDSSVLGCSLTSVVCVIWCCVVFNPIREGESVIHVNPTSRERERQRERPQIGWVIKKDRNSWRTAVISNPSCIGRTVRKTYSCSICLFLSVSFPVILSDLIWSRLTAACLCPKPSLWDNSPWRRTPSGRGGL